MALGLGGCTFLKNATMLEQLLEEINFQRTKEMRQLMKDDSGFVVLQGTTYWTDLFVRHFLFQEEQAIDCDDLLFFVRKRHVKGSSRYLPKYEVYASPSRRKMDTKGEGEEMTYPHICFMVDNFDEVFCDIVVRDGEMVCVELVARGRGGSAQAVIFLGSIRYDTLTRVYDSRQTSLSTKVAQRMSFGLLGSKTAARCEFVRMKGPGGKGHAEMAVSRPRGAGVDTPTSEPGLAATDMWDSDWDEDPEELFVYRHQRRLSDPSANINNFTRSGWRTKDNRDKSRSENEGLDSMVSGVAEVEAGDLRDGRRRPASSARRACQPAMRDLYPRAPRDLSSPACLHTVCPRPPSAALCTAPSAPRPLPPARRAARPRALEPGARCELADEAAALDEAALLAERAPGVLQDAGGRAAVRGCEERVRAARGAGGAAAGDARCYVTLPRARGGLAAAMFRRERLPARRTTPDGTDIYYWCDVPRKKHNELDAGLYNPLWAMRGFSQTFHLWKEGKRQSSSPLNAFLTYVTLPWWTIAKDILDHREEPILTF
uniref:Uncharacterized protein n=1 Tax=Bombyx mori TaxID=7091 RepID=A0A8R2QWV8_BOMMO|nr:uncharacterized protein LOC101736574 isoform X2 [Bombyx mori]